MAYEIEMSQLFQDNYRLLPPDRERLIKERVDILREKPYPPGQSKKQLIGPKNPTRYRIRSGKYRVVYSIDADTVQLWNVDTRANVYVRHTATGYESIGQFDIDTMDEDDPSIEVLEPDPTPDEDWEHYREQLRAWTEAQAALEPAPIEVEPVEAEPTPLPRRITHDLLRRIRVPRRYHKVLAACGTDVDLLRAMTIHGVPSDQVDRVFNVVTDPDYDRIVAQPRKQLKQVEDLTRFYEGDLIDFQIALDPAQKQMAQQIVRTGGPWLINGAAGTGKSTILLDAAIDLYRGMREKGKEPAILVTTFTNALVTTLVTELDRIFPEWHDGIDVRTTDDVMLEIARVMPDGKHLKKSPSLQGILRPIARDILAPDYYQTSLLPSSQEPGAMNGEYITLDPLSGMSWEYLLDEIEAVIIGRNMCERDDYVTADRPGRRVGLNEAQRLRIWDISEAFSRELESRKWTTWARTRQRAANLLANDEVRLHYDAVFIDEAQDLQPNVIRMLVEIAKSAEHGVRDLYLAADANQTIYGSGVSWVSIHPDLRLTGRSRRLSTNHRCTRQILEAAKAYLHGAELEDDRSTIEHRHVGPKPVAIRGVTREVEVELIIDFFRAACGEISRDIELCAVLVPTERAGKRMQSELALAGIPAKFMPTRKIDFHFPGAKILTRHAAKGMEFPIVALSLTDSGHHHSTQSEESHEARMKERRVNHMAMTRAMRSLLVTLPESDEDGLFGGITEPLWQVQATTPAGIGTT